MTYYISPGAIKVHGITSDKLKELSEFEDHGKEIPVKSTFCTMKYMTNILKLPRRHQGKCKWPKQEEIINFLGIAKITIQDFTKSNFWAEKISEHDARFDAAGVYFIYDYICSKYLKDKTIQNKQAQSLIEEV